MSEPTKMEKFLLHIEETYGLDNSEGIQLAVQGLKRADVNEMAFRWVQHCIVKRARNDTLRVERSASVSITKDMQETPSTPKGVGGTKTTPKQWKNPNRMAKWEWELFVKSPEYPAWEESEREFQANTDRLNRELWDKLEDNLRVYTEEMRVQWTEELLNAQFNLPDGTAVTWGSATKEQHEARYEMFKNNAMANLEGASRHKQAIEELQKTGAVTLIEATQQRSAA